MAGTGTLIAIVIICAGVWILAHAGWSILHSPLNAAPSAHWSCKYTGFWIWYHRLLEREAGVVRAAHLKHGPVIRLGPNEISVNDVEGGLKPIYDGRMPKTDFYDVASSYGEAPMVAIKDEKPHQQRKRLVAKPYGKTTLMQSQAWQAEQAKLAQDLVQGLDKLLSIHSEVDLYDVFFAWSLATISAYLFGRSGCLNLLNDMPEAARLREKYFLQRTPQFLSAVVPIPEFFRRWTGTEAEIGWIWELQNRVEKATVFQQAGEEWQPVYNFMKQSMRYPQSKESTTNAQITPTEDAQISSEMQDHMIAGIDTSLSVLTACAYLLSLPHNQHWQSRLREEIGQVPQPASFSQLEQLPVLNAIIKETLRLYPPVAGGLPRVTDKAVLVGPPGHQIALPPGVTIHCQAESLHRNAVFYGAEAFYPERWINSSPEKKKEMERWFWAFGSGTRRCVGENLAMSNILLVVAMLWGRYETRVTPSTTLKMTQGIVSMPMPTDGSFMKLHVENVLSH